jgi:hypothetical protein
LRLQAAKLFIAQTELQTFASWCLCLQDLSYNVQKAGSHFLMEEAVVNILRKQAAATQLKLKRCFLCCYIHFLVQRQLHEERMASLLTDRKVRQQEEERHRANFAVQIEQLTAQVAKLEEALRNTTKSYVIGKMTWDLPMHSKYIFSMTKAVGCCGRMLNLENNSAHFCK